MAVHRLPDEFVWGVATSAQQIEGGVREDGRGESIWDRFAATPGRIADGSDPTVACDHYHLWREDIGLMQWLGVGAYRFSIAWPRIFPDGRGAINGPGLDFYDSLVDTLLEAGITPFVTLYHWDLPQALQDAGGWGRRDTVDAFAEYAGVVASRLGDRVRHWITHNEPWCVAVLGHEEGHHAPGHTDAFEALRVAHHVLLSHGRAAREIRNRTRDARVGISHMLVPAWPASQSDADLDAARFFDGLFNRWYLDPVFLGSYPEDAIEDRVRRGQLPSTDLPFVRECDLEEISAPMDFFGLNYYSRLVARAGDSGEPEAVQVVPEDERTDMGWEVFPDGLHRLLIRLNNDYDLPDVYITENGAAYTDSAGSDGRIRDARRIHYLHGHIDAIRRAVSAGVPVRGYFVWSLMDNWEWALGYEKRFGLYEVDFFTQKRTARDSAHWYRNTIASNAIDTTV
jgi:beta-glucosidase